MKNLYFKAILLCLCLFASINGFAHDAMINGIYYNFSGNEATVTYRGDDEFSDGEYSGSVVIPKTVTYNGKTYSVTSIGQSAFHNCKNLTSVTIPSSVTSIESFAFTQCENLTSITIPSSVTSIGDCAFSETAWFDNQPDGLVYAGLVAYKYKGEMPANTKIVIKEGTKGIAENAFDDYCQGLISITIPSSVISIGRSAFSGCTGLTSVTIPSSVISIGCSAFSDCTGLTSVTIPSSVTSIEYAAFQYCTGLTSVTIPSSVTNIGDYAFHRCTSLTSITIPSSVTSIGNDAFSGCTGLTSVTIPSSVTSIEYAAFNQCI